MRSGVKGVVEVEKGREKESRVEAGQDHGERRGGEQEGRGKEESKRGKRGGTQPLF